MLPSSTRRFTHKQALLDGWQLQTLPLTAAHLNLETGPPVRIESHCFIAPPRGWDTFQNVIESIFVVRRKCDLPSHAVNVVPSSLSCDTKVVTPSDNHGWAVAMDATHWEEGVGYGTIYWDATAASSILDWTFREHDILPPGYDLRRTGARVLQVFLTGNKPSGSLTHQDTTSSLLYCVAGAKTVYIAPPGTEKFLNLAVQDHHFLDYNPDQDRDRNSAVWQKCTLGPGDSLFIPKGWWHYVRSVAGTVALSFVLTPSRSNHKRKSASSSSSTSSSSSRSTTTTSSTTVSSSSSSSSSGKKIKRSTTKSKKKVLQVDVEDDTSSNNWLNIIWVYFVVSKTCQRWPAAVLNGGQLVYIGRPGVEVESTSFAVLEQFLGTIEDVQKQTSNYKESAELNHAVEVAMGAFARINERKKT